MQTASVENAAAPVTERTRPLRVELAIDQADRHLAASMRAALAGRPCPSWPSGWSRGEIVEVFAERARFHGVAVFLGQTFAAFPGWPTSVVDRLREEMRLAALWEELHRAHIVAMIDRLAAAGIETMVMKGTALAYLHYPDPAMRRRGDTDLLIRPQDLARTRELLEHSGFRRREDPHGLYFQETWLIDCGAQIVHSIDLHWAPADRPVLQKILRAEQFWASRQPIPRLSPNTAAPDPLLLLLHGAVNQAWHVARGFSVDEDMVLGGRRLIWSLDYARLTQDFSSGQWDTIIAFCKAHDAAAILAMALRGVHEDLGLPLPEQVMDRLLQSAAASPAYDYITKPGRISDFKADFSAAGSTAVRLRMLESAAFAPRRHLLGKYPHLSHWPTFLLQLRRYAEGLARWGEQVRGR